MSMAMSAKCDDIYDDRDDDGGGSNASILYYGKPPAMKDMVARPPCGWPGGRAAIQYTGCWLIRNPSWDFQVGRSSSSSRDAFNSSTVTSRQSGGSSRSYLSSVLINSAKQRAAGLRWSQPDKAPKGDKREHLMPTISPQASVMCSCTISTPEDGEGDELPISSHLLDDQLEESVTVAEILYYPDVLSMLGDYDKFKSEQELRLQEWFQDSQDDTK